MKMKVNFLSPKENENKNKPHTMKLHATAENLTRHLKSVWPVVGIVFVGLKKKEEEEEDLIGFE